jgi:hypothetical protein
MTYDINRNRWLAVTAWRILELIERPNADEPHLVGLYLNEVKEVAGVPRFMEWLAFFGNFGLTDKQRQKLQREAKEQEAA